MKLIEKKCRACEMESFGLFYNAQKLGCNAACILTISDNILTGEETSSEERQKFYEYQRIDFELSSYQSSLAYYIALNKK